MPVSAIYIKFNNSWWKINQYGYYDVLCRSVSYYLLRDYIEVANLIPEAEWHISREDWAKSWLVTDMDGITTNPHLQFSEDKIDQYFSLYNPVPFEGNSEEDMLAAIQSEWDKRGVSFREGAASLITVWTQSMGFACVGHAAVLIEYDAGYLLFEKTNPEYPYQATKFDTLEETKNYMIRQFNSTFEEDVDPLVVMRNKELL